MKQKYKFPERYTLQKNEVESEHPEEVLEKIRLTPDIYEPLHKIFRPSWAKDIKPK
jgi:hypothetical protein